VDDSLNLQETPARTRFVVGRGLWGFSSPTTPAYGDSNAVELGLRFRSTVAGTVEGVRFYKGAGNTGVHLGHLWSEAGVQLGEVTFTGETETGWQQALFASPIEIQANTTYVVSYFAPAGHYAVDRPFFQNERMVEPLRALPDPNGVYKYGGGFPNLSGDAPNYWVDVVFVPSRGLWPRSTVPAVPAYPDGMAVELGVKFRSDLPGLARGIRFYKGATNTGIHVGTLWTQAGAPLAQVTFTNETASGWQTALFKDPVLLEANTTYVVSYFAPNGNYAVSRPYFLSERVSHPLRAPADVATNLNGVYKYGGGFPTQGALDEGGRAANYWVDVMFTPIRGFWDDFTIPVISGQNDSNDVTLGMRFKSTVPGKIYGIRFYKGAGNGGVHRGRLWTDTGTPISDELVFTSETPNGWQQALFPSPIAILADVTYVVSYRTPQGFYAVDRPYFIAELVRGALRAPQNGASSPNGVFRYGDGGFPNVATLPDDPQHSPNYWVDVVFYAD
jgi:hypothetical protein